MSYVTYSVWDTPEGSRAFRVFIAFTVLPIAAVVIRFWSRAVVGHTRFGWDDWFCLLALKLLDIALEAMGFWWLRHGLGHHVATVPPQNIVAGLKALWTGIFVFGLSVGCIKTSALCLYSRIFTKQAKWFHRAIILGHVVVVAFYLCIVFLCVFQCTPVAKAWDPTIEGHCIDAFKMYISTTVWDVCLDLYILILPMPVLYRLHIRPKLKILAAIVFVLAYSCIVASVGRLVAIASIGEGLNGDFFYVAVSELVWVSVEPGVGIISICIPSWWQLYVRARKNGVGALFNRREYLSAVSPHELGSPEHKNGIVSVPAAAGADDLLYDQPRSTSQQHLNVLGSGNSRGPLSTAASEGMSTSDEERSDSVSGIERYRTETSEVRIV